jgi:hypothetical protein
MTDWWGKPPPYIGEIWEKNKLLRAVEIAENN